MRSWFSSLAHDEQSREMFLDLALPRERERLSVMSECGHMYGCWATLPRVLVRFLSS